MNRNIGKKFLCIITIGFMMIGISLFNIGRNDVELQDLYGKRSELENVNILFQSKKGYYETDDIKIDKDNVTVDYMVKQAIYNFNLSKKNIDGREVLEAVSNGFVDYTDALFDDKDKLASAYVTNEYTQNGDYKTYANIKIKYNNSDKVESYEVFLGDKNVDGSGLIYSSVPIGIDDDNMYIVTLGSYYSNEYLEEIESERYEEYADDIFNKTVLNLYKVNLSNKSAKHILNKEYEGSDIYVRSDVCFSNNNKSYFLINEKNKVGIYKSSLFEFDVLSKEINTIDLGTQKDTINYFSVDDGKLYLLSFGGVGDSENITTESSLVRGVLVNLETLKVEYVKQLDLGADYSDVIQVRRLNNKIYVVTNEYEMDEQYSSNYYYSVSIFNEDNNEIVYKGIINQNSSYFTQVGIVKEDEL